MPINKFAGITALKSMSSYQGERTAALYPGPLRRGLRGRVRKHRTRSTLRIASGMRPLMGEVSAL